MINKKTNLKKNKTKRKLKKNQHLAKGFTRFFKKNLLGMTDEQILEQKRQKLADEARVSREFRQIREQYQQAHQQIQQDNVRIREERERQREVQRQQRIKEEKELEEKYRDEKKLDEQLKKNKQNLKIAKIFGNKETYNKELKRQMKEQHLDLKNRLDEKQRIHQRLEQEEIERKKKVIQDIEDEKHRLEQEEIKKKEEEIKKK